MSTVILASAGYDHKIRFWEAPTGDCSRSLRFTDSQVNCLQITPDKLFIAAGGNPHIRLFDVAGSASPNPVGSEDGSVRVWDLRSPGCQRTYDCGCMVNTVVLHPDQAQLISGDQTGRVRWWDLQSNSCVSEVIPEGKVAIRSLSIANDLSAMAIGNNEANVYVGQPESASGFTQTHQLKAHPRYLLKLALSPDASKLVTTSADKTAKLWNTRTWEVEQTLKDHQRWVWDAAFSADSSYLVTACSDHHPRLWNLRTGDLVRKYVGHNLAVTCVALNDGTGMRASA